MRRVRRRGSCTAAAAGLVGEYERAIDLKGLGIIARVPCDDGRRHGHRFKDYARGVFCKIAADNDASIILALFARQPVDLTLRAVGHLPAKCQPASIARMSEATSGVGVTFGPGCRFAHPG
jgi:hypothetical protein